MILTYSTNVLSNADGWKGSVVYWRGNVEMGLGLHL